jgi:hypothetical protein
MKSIITTIVLLCSVSALTASCGDPHIAALTSAKADTIFLSDDGTGQEIAKTWLQRPHRPVLIFKSQQELQLMAKNPVYLWSEEKRKWARRYD